MLEMNLKANINNLYFIDYMEYQKNKNDENKGYLMRERGNSKNK